MTTKDINKMTVESLKALSVEELQDYIETAKYNNMIVVDMIRDRNLFRSLYYQLLDQIRDAGLEPVETYENLLSKKGD